MLRVRDIMTREVRALSPETTVREAMEILSQSHISGAPVVTGNAVVGVVSTDDLLIFASTLRDVPTQRDNTLEADEWVDIEVWDGDEEYDDEEVVESKGFFATVLDDGATDASERMVHVELPADNSLEGHEVSEMMTRELWALPSTARASEAAGMMQQHGIHRVLVVDDGKLVGIVSALDIAKAVSDGRFEPAHKAK